MRKYPYTLLTFFLAVFLLFPFVLKLRNPGLEIYPAVILPSGAGLASNNLKILTITSRNFYGIGDGMELKKIDERLFFKGIPTHYIPYIQAAGFGLEKYIGESKMYTPPIKFQVRNNFTDETYNTTKKWFRRKLREQRMEDSVFYIRKYKYEYNIETQETGSKTLIDEEVFKVY